MSRRLLAGLLLWLMAVAPSRATDLRLCYERWEPFVARGPAGTDVGPLADIARELAARAGLRPTLSELPYARCLGAIEVGQYHGMLGTSDEASLTEVGGPIGYWVLAAFVHADDPADRFTGLDMFRGKVVGLSSAYTSYTPEIDAFTDWRVDRARDALLNLRRLSARRIDVTFTDVIWWRAVEAEHRLAVRALPPALASTPQYLTLAKGRYPDLEVHLADLLGVLETEGVFDRAFLAHTGRSWRDLQRAAADHVTPP